jgi:hypothetical protein
MKAKPINQTKLTGSKKKMKPTSADSKKLLVLVTMVGWILVDDRLNALE